MINRGDLRNASQLRTLASALLLASGLTLVATSFADAIDSDEALTVGKNLVRNGNFDEDLSGWNPINACSAWTSLDAHGAPDSGSATIIQRSFRVDSCSLDSKCIPVTGGHRYVAGAYVGLTLTWNSHDYVRNLHRNTNGTQLILVWSRDAACGDPIGSESFTPGYYSTAYFMRWNELQRVVSPPADARSAYFHLNVHPVPFLFVSTAWIDDIVLAPVTSASTTTLTDSTTTTTLTCDGTCGRPVGGALVTVSDALYILEVAIGEQTCASCICDVNDDGDISATDALLTLAASVGGPVSLTCPQ